VKLKNFSVTVRVWRQNGPNDKGQMLAYKVDDVSPAMSFLEMLDVLNENLIKKATFPLSLKVIAEKASADVAA